VDILWFTEQLNTAKQEEHSIELEVEKPGSWLPSAVWSRAAAWARTIRRQGDRLFWGLHRGRSTARSIHLPEKYVGQMKKVVASLTSPDAPAERHLAKVVEVSPVVDPSSGTIEVLAELSGPRGELRPGMNVVVRVPSLP
jgi:multidrug efflux pump subunit AcrA (membrane-fusion protein)